MKRLGNYTQSIFLNLSISDLTLHLSFLKEFMNLKLKKELREIIFLKEKTQNSTPLLLIQLTSSLIMCHLLKDSLNQKLKRVHSLGLLPISTCMETGNLQSWNITSSLNTHFTLSHSQAKSKTIVNSWLPLQNYKNSKRE